MEEGLPTVDDASLGLKAVGCARKLKSRGKQTSKHCSPVASASAPASDFLLYRDLKVEAK